MKCSECNQELETRESWVDDGEEYRHIEYFYCADCRDIRDRSGKPIQLETNKKTKDDPLDSITK